MTGYFLAKRSIRTKKDAGVNFILIPRQYSTTQTKIKSGISTGNYFLCLRESINRRTVSIKVNPPIYLIDTKEVTYQPLFISNTRIRIKMIPFSFYFFNQVGR
ncbi:MAG: hypothetical protein A2X25_10270 [Chloroflexi bacterium GWB2_49_20]|nr:MAG: hypothetical protein A2X25_10270 [Chloroflexi bacterium GWB2_49_20]OGN79198.1 MAG: hypothetical protein A2X26_03750 [Chloroflexi bacterium GWC2_49_37]OGN83032.1 MAG: hypothetical protein A2X27_08945 [Chloroflexi bacterium GWD2_49_16]HCC78693.1 hypothetical protein [Anaerolineae bacterium]